MLQTRTMRALHTNYRNCRCTFYGTTESEEFVLLHFYDHFSPLRSMNTRSWVLETIFSRLATFWTKMKKFFIVGKNLSFTSFKIFFLTQWCSWKLIFRKLLPISRLHKKSVADRWLPVFIYHRRKKTHQFDDVCRKKKTRILISSSNFVSFILNYKNSHRCIKFHRLIFRPEWVRSAAGNPFHSVADLFFYFFRDQQKEILKFIAMAQDVLNSFKIIA